MKVDRELLKGSTAILVLKLLDQEPMYGYQIIKKLETQSEGVFRFQEGTLYPVLHSMESQGWVDAFWEGNEGGRRRKYYRLTDAGHAQLQEKQQEWNLFSSAVNRVLGRWSCEFSR